jgi:plastocyanin
MADTVRNLLAIALSSALLASACGGNSREGAAVPDVGGTSAPAPSSPSSTTPTPSASGRVVDVQMLGDASGYRFQPATITIKPGDTVRWTNVSGGPHNVTFWTDSIPAGAVSPLQAGMPQQTAQLSGPLLTAPNATYTVSFAGVPAGTYKYYCTPHLALGMKATIIIQ